MEIKIRDNAHEVYAARVNCGHYSHLNGKWYDTLKAVAGKTLVVETDCLFKDQFNTAPVPGVSDLGLRIMMDSVEEVIDDEREYKMRCNYCGKTDYLRVTCQNCDSENKYLEPLSKSAEVSYSYMTRAKAERLNGGSCVVKESMPWVDIKMSDGSEYFFQGEEADNLIEEYKAIDWLSCSIEDYFLAVAQGW